MHTKSLSPQAFKLSYLFFAMVPLHSNHEAKEELKHRIHTLYKHASRITNELQRDWKVESLRGGEEGGFARWSH